MRRTRTLAGIGIAAAALLALTACNSGTPTSTGSGSDDETETSSTPWTILTDVEIDGSPTFDRITSSGTVKVGVKEDQPGLGYLDPVTGERTGFDVDIARWMAASLGIDPEKIEFQAIASANREQAIVNGDIDYYVGTYSITDKRKELISFAGPYFLTGQGLLVAADSEIESVDDLDSSMTVCSATGSTPIQNIKTNYPDVPTKEYDTYSKCVEDLKNGQVDAVTTDEAILIGYAAQAPDEIKVVGEPFSEERYGIGIAKDDTALVEYFNTQLTEGGDIWQAIFDNNLGASGVEGTQPEVDPVG
ncbi:MAG: glutamate ABC transporter substrate-binding protein [Microbacterium sp.]